jgi:hypothetical protein
MGLFDSVATFQPGSKKLLLVYLVAQINTLAKLAQANG